MMATIKFYKIGDAYGCFSNFSGHPITLEGRQWPTSEHFFQAKKFDDATHVEKIRTASSPTAAKRLGGSRKVPLRADWETVKDDVMYEALKAKFTQHAFIKKVLLDTGDAKLVEHSRLDKYWADAGDGTGKNMLGVLLMKLRDELRTADHEAL